nr:MAG TPA: hypothetical protein [Caudoviricetes sp.]
MCHRFYPSFRPIGWPVIVILLFYRFAVVVHRWFVVILGSQCYKRTLWRCG